MYNAASTSLLVLHRVLCANHRLPDRCPFPLPTVRWHPRPREAKQMAGKAIETQQVSLATSLSSHQSAVTSRSPSPTFDTSWRRPGSGLTDLGRDWAGFACSEALSFSHPAFQSSSHPVPVFASIVPVPLCRNVILNVVHAGWRNAPGQCMRPGRASPAASG
ncbi:hypothetical protein G7Z17_g7925 [Cylindrodendrum hubeiense]|uniref:Uncharacterized protein n=1 Tax=Cylindrodendrum hubeiense TaxID=595255 RepID=A0A9P5LDP7_9HYPO|nr:hypothetical protein G7Z17_g7925 [Cylindrodendrum hubeiense]